MNNIYIKSLPVNLFNGVFSTTINFTNGLNIISGVNGTGKTEVLKLFKSTTGILSANDKNYGDLAIFAISPKRNTEKQAIDSIFQQVKTLNKTAQTFINEVKGRQIKDTGFENYPSFAELFIQEYDLLMQDGVTGYEKAIASTSEKFNEVLQQVFPDYQIEAKWITGATDASGKLDLKVKKYLASPITIDQLSTGEREVLSLLFCIFVSREKEDVYLIDEPEIHLNWDLERGLFNFFNWFCEKFQKQIIVVTHSRIIFSPEFYSRTQFFVWENDKIVCKNDINEKQKSSIAGEISNIINIIGFQKPTFFVEDEKHKKIVSCLANILTKDIEIIVCGNKSNVKTMFNLLKGKGSKDVYFIVDGDNEGPSISDACFVFLKKYCIENYLFDPVILSKVFNVSETDVITKIVDCIKGLNHSTLLVYKKLAESVSPFPLDVLDTLDGSKICNKLIKEFGKTEGETIEAYVAIAQSEGKLDTIFGEITEKLK